MLRINLHDLCSTSRPLFTKSNLVVAGASAHTASVGALVDSTSGCSTGASDGSASVGCSTGASDGSSMNGIEIEGISWMVGYVFMIYSSCISQSSTYRLGALWAHRARTDPSVASYWQERCCTTS